MSIYGGPDIVTDGLVLCIDAGNIKSYPGSGSLLYDLSPRKNIFSLYDNYIINSYGLTLDGTGWAGIWHHGSLSFDSGNYTVCVWNRENVDSTPNYAGIITNDNTDDNSWKITKEATATHYYARFSSTSYYNFPQFIIGKFHMYAFSFNSGVAQLYFDGSPGFTTSGVSNPTNQEYIAFGSYRYNDAQAGRYMHNQTIGVTTLYNKALSSVEILQNYNSLKSRYGL